MEIRLSKSVASFIEDLPISQEQRVHRTISRLRNYGHLIRQPHSKHVEKDMFELRIAGASHIRILYFFHKEHAFLAHAFFKKRQKLTRKDIELGFKINEMYLAGI